MAAQEEPADAGKLPDTAQVPTSTHTSLIEHTRHTMQGFGSAGREEHQQASRVALPLPQQVLQGAADEAQAVPKVEVPAGACDAAEALDGSPRQPQLQLPRVAQPLGGSGRPAQDGVKLVNLLNPNNSQYDQAFALEYARMK
jgi:hypothetical protein